MTIKGTKSTVGGARAALGDVAVLPGDAAWETMRRAWNLATDQRPSAIAALRTPDDAATVVRFAAANGLRIAGQGSGHGAGPMRSLDGALLVRTSSLNDVTIDADARRVRIGAGTRWRDVTIPAARHGLAALAGSSPDVGIVGYTLGGGIGWLARRYGIAANSVHAVELVTADGELRRATLDNEPELFWALRGGGGNFGLVTALEFDLYPIVSIYAGNMFWPMERAAEILDAWRRRLSEMPREVTSSARLFQFPDLAIVPEPVRGRSFVVIGAACLTDRETADGLLRPWRALGPEMDTFATIPMPELGAVSMDPEDPLPVLGDGMVLHDLSTATIDALVREAGPGAGSPLLMIDLRHLGGALAESEPQHGALDRLDGDAVCFMLGVPMDADHGSAISDRLDRIQHALAPWTAGRYFNFSDRPTDIRSIFSPTTYARLQAVKRSYDPESVFQANHAIEISPAPNDRSD